jgi:DNA-binding beta-propeller fold protein YncE
MPALVAHFIGVPRPVLGRRGRRLRGGVVVVDPRTRAVTQRVHVAGCTHDHGLIIDATRAFVACDGNAMLVVLRLSDLTSIGSQRIGQDPDVLALDPARHLLYVAVESGVLTTIDTASPAGKVTGRAGVGGNSHVVAVDPSTGLAYFPLSAGADGTPELRIMTPVR